MLSRRAFGAGLCAWLVAVAGPAAGRAGAAPADGADLMRKYCFECHGDGARKGGVDLKALLGSGSRRAQQREWEKAWKIVRHEFMPPVGADMPSDAERQAITDWVLREVFAVDSTKPDPGRVTIRRLNRVEYENSVQDLFGADLAAEQSYSSDGAGAVLRLRDRLPPDDTAYGFDNNGDFLTVSVGLLEKYFDLAEFVTSRVIQETPREPERQLGAGVKATRSATDASTSHAVEVVAEKPGRYRVDVQFTLGGWQDFGGAYEFNLRLGGQTLARDLVEIGGYKRYRFTNTVELAAGTHPLVFTTDPRKPDFKGRTNHLELRSQVTVTGPLGLEHASFPEPHRRLFPRGSAPADAAGREAYAREILERVAIRAFRRPVDPATVDGLVGIARSQPVFERGIAQAVSAILTSPRFFYRAETQPRPDDPKSIHLLDEHALASRLSYLLWLSIPDDELLRLAGEGRLRSNLRQQVKRMLADRKSERFFEDFPGQWLRTRNVLMTAISKDEMLAPVRGAMKRETEMLFEHIAREDRDLIELVTADYSFLNRPLAEFYGLTNVAGATFQKVTFAPGSHRGGLLTHGSFLVATSNPNRTSPVKRGLFVLENLLGIEPPPPPADVPALDDAKAGGVTPKTVREQLAVHRENKSCASCHAHFDPIGVVLENYDLIGRWRETENGERIETREKAVTGEVLAGIGDVRALFAARKARFYRGATEKLMTYALGRGLDPGDAPAVDAIVKSLLADGGKFSTLLTGVIESPEFQMRRGDEGGSRDAPRLAIPATPPPEKRRPPKRRPMPTNTVTAAAGVPAASTNSPANQNGNRP